MKTSGKYLILTWTCILVALPFLGSLKAIPFGVLGIIFAIIGYKCMLEEEQE